ncbi:hypothetical protein F511_29792 [Dorcoceras hygrometricum]|uniref:Uncharacterized protein n=1 Tax=Dorcoceras hygrometricum TaxID=472368 RepID=A0A2Z7BY54_9LAMI|nr:hypothetical protein F511_29792 [Dorcoceras hygrometricum]
MQKLECHVKKLSEAREEDKNHILELERELSNCCQEIDYLQDQLKTRNFDLNCLDEEISSLRLKLANMENLEEEVRQLREQIKISESEWLLLMEELENKEVIIRNSASCLEKLEESISSMGLEYQCEIESAKLELIALQQNFFEVQRLLEEKTRQSSSMNEQDLELQIQDADKVNEILDKETKELKEKGKASELHAKGVSEKMEEKFNGPLRKNGYHSSKTENGTSTSKFATPEALDVELRNKIDEMTCQIDDYELLVRQLKEELRNEKLKAKEEAEDLTQEMAELRYQLTGLLEEECKRRACIEQISLHRIAELEAQVCKTPISCLPYRRELSRLIIVFTFCDEDCQRTAKILYLTKPCCREYQQNII